MWFECSASRNGRASVGQTWRAEHCGSGSVLDLLKLIIGEPLARSQGADRSVHGGWAHLCRGQPGADRGAEPTFYPAKDRESMMSLEVMQQLVAQPAPEEHS